MPEPALTPEQLDALPVVPLLLYVDAQRNRYEFRSQQGTLALLRGMDRRDQVIARALAQALLEALDEVDDDV